MRGGHAVRRRLLLPGAAALLLAAGGLAHPPAADAAEPCRRAVTGEELPSGAGPLPLIEQLGLRQAWDLATGSGVTVAVIDSGVDARHPDLTGSVRRGSEFTIVRDATGYSRTTPEPEQDCEGHGTAVAGLVAARRAEGDRMTGVAPGAAVYPVRIADGVERATTEILAAAIDDAVAAGAGVINLSLAVPTDYEPIREAVARAVEADVVVVAAAGNEGNQGISGGRMYPAAYDGVLAVGAVGNDGQPLDSSNAGPWVDLAGYGADLAVVAPGGTGYRVESGTSFAAAQVSGTAALVRSRFPGLTAAEVARRLTDSATPVGGGRNDRTGAGLVDPFGALTDLGPAEAAEAPAARVPVRPLPPDEPLLGPTTATALAVSGGLLLAVVLGLLGAPAARRAARRGWRTGPDAAGDPLPAAAPARLDWLDGGDSRPDPRNRKR
ncbi:type VII secretion-associated serine protease mycosin [Streptomyces litchfieldiae]|uniref:Type VII secretion-associated serine protease mycosin n=1 Tax=Streptomyces litchfieldiae TaxID=3075543 RepID=A0ABU2MSB8_9ACTN|nr:type VII secretion-associated serine protease mycosin [Streptomyces sp. DSM 44938]MDT0344218.1 type VII secretion-associated serine protease mycosin [Streptomyces sp. DSM 44938]